MLSFTVFFTIVIDTLKHKFLELEFFESKLPSALDFSNVDLNILFHFITFRRRWGNKDEFFPIIPTDFHYIGEENNDFAAEKSDLIGDIKKIL